ncbi:unnamed protein product [Oppiella nova]|uniref:Uncharacterized protein n=1 Tax=Oppiella nova TaxID=334625 RepID=A0A7R9QP81_9ACAR|nr:unnamed protein product [Oppiella nova]CAG2169260.1 unnamed protein product [Oppiella nova]
MMIEFLNVFDAKCEKFDCLIDQKVGYEDPSNIYQCKDTENCCIEFARPSCCKSKPGIQIVGEQLSIWGTLFGILFVISAIVYCRKKDLYFIKYVKKCFIACCCGRQTESEETERNNIIHTISRAEADSTV